MNNRQYKQAYTSGLRLSRRPRRTRLILNVIQLLIAIYAVVLSIYVFTSGSRVFGSNEIPPGTGLFNALSAQDLDEDKGALADGGNIFAGLPYYIEDLLPRYEAYKNANPHMAYEDAVWQVNVNLDREFYEAIEIIGEGNPLLVNKYYQLPQDFIPVSLVEMNNGHMATPETAEAFHKMRNACMAEGLIIDVSSAYRSYTYQENIYDRYAAESGKTQADLFSARPGHSEHQTGRALDITGSFGSLDSFIETPEFAWIMDNAHQYGFIIRYGKTASAITGFMYEPWHITYVGEEIAAYMRDNHIATLEEYVGKGLYNGENGDINRLSAAPEKDAGKLIFIDPGHGGADDGSVHYGAAEKDINLQIALKLKGYLEANGYAIHMARQDDRYIEKAQRVDMANYFNAGLYVSIHQNGFEDDSAHGLELWHNDKNADGPAKSIYTAILSETGAKGRGFEENDEYYVLKYTDMPAMIIETGFLSSAKESILLQDSAYQDKLAYSIYQGIDNWYKPKAAYLTFDDGPSEKYTNAVLDILAERNIKATFFLVGANVARYPDTAKRIADEGHTIGVHCYNHDYKTLYASADAYEADFNKALEIIYETTGVSPQIYRFPGGSINDFNKNNYEEIIERMAAGGYAYFDWNVDIGDTKKTKTPQTLIDNALSHWDNTVLLMHDIVPETTIALPDIINLYEKNGYVFKTLSQEAPSIQFRKGK